MPTRPRLIGNKHYPDLSNQEAEKAVKSIVRQTAQFRNGNTFKDTTRKRALEKKIRDALEEKFGIRPSIDVGLCVRYQISVTCNFYLPDGSVALFSVTVRHTPKGLIWEPEDDLDSDDSEITFGRDKNSDDAGCASVYGLMALFAFLLIVTYTLQPF